MQMENERRSENYEDRRGDTTGSGVGGGGFGGGRGGGGGALMQLLMMLMSRGGMKGFGLIAVLAIAAWQFAPGLFKGMLGGGGTNMPAAGATGGTGKQFSAAEEQLKDFCLKVLASTEDVWDEQFARMGKTYKKPTLVFFSGVVQSACGQADAAVGPFYCPGDSKLYIDLSFYQVLRERLGAPGDFAQAYVIAHEVGHHVQNLLGASDMVHAKKGRVSEAEYNNWSVRLELQADFYAGLWAHHADRMRKILESGDIEEGLNAAEKIGDDALQRKSSGHVRPETFTHGTSAQRARWFRLGYTTGDVKQGDTFGAKNL